MREKKENSRKRNENQNISSMFSFVPTPIFHPLLLLLVGPLLSHPIFLSSCLLLLPQPLVAAMAVAATIIRGKIKIIIVGDKKLFQSFYKQGKKKNTKEGGFINFREKRALGNQDWGFGNLEKEGVQKANEKENKST